MSDRIIIGIDPGTTITGYGIISCKGKKMSLLACGVIKLGSQKISHPEKLKKIFQRISSLVEDFGANEMALEAPFHGKNVQSMLKLGRAQGVAMAAGLIHDLPIFEYAPKKVKMAVTGSGSASKEQVAKMLETHLGREIASSYMDATDGLAVAVCHFFQGNFSQKNTNYKDWASFIENNPKRIKQ
ncbi:MAG: crossover junction endodeoxyribonuclease RuvC [Bacteroidia bacterium]